MGRGWASWSLGRAPTHRTPTASILIPVWAGRVGNVREPCTLQAWCVLKEPALRRIYAVLDLRVKDPSR